MNRTLADRLRLIVITDPDCGRGRDLLDVVRAGLAGGAPAIQLRAKHLPTRQLLDLGKALRELTRSSGALLFVNDRIDVALAVAADGAHLGQDDLRIQAARRIVPAPFLLGVSVDTPEEAVVAEKAGASYVGLGPVYATGSKLDAGPVIGPAGVRAVRAVCGLPIVAIGGIDAANAAEAVQAGADGVAVIRAVMGAEDPGVAASTLIAAVERGRSQSAGRGDEQRRPRG